MRPESAKLLERRLRFARFQEVLRPSQSEVGTRPCHSSRFFGRHRGYSGLTACNDATAKSSWFFKSRIRVGGPVDLASRGVAGHVLQLVCAELIRFGRQFGRRFLSGYRFSLHKRKLGSRDQRRLESPLYCSAKFLAFPPQTVG